MSGFIFQNPSALLWLFSLPILALLIFTSSRWLKGLALTTDIKNRQRLRVQILMLISVVFAILALARPSNNPQPQTVFSSGRDVLFLLDVSKSMLADDILPSRLERAKMAIISTLDSLTLNDRVALVLFSGTATVVSPLTNDFSFFRKSVSEASRRSVAIGGTKLSSALVKSSEKVFTEDSKGNIDVIVLTDGEDQDSDLNLAVDALNKNGSQLILVGFGDRQIGSRLKQKDGTFLVENGEEIWTKMKSRVLETLAEQCTGGIFLDVGTKNINLGEVYQQIVKHKTTKKANKNKQFRYSELYQYFLFIAILLLAWAGVASNRKRNHANQAVLLFFLVGTSFSSAAEADGYDSGFEVMEKRAQNMAKYIVASREKVDQEELNILDSMTAYNMGYDLLQAESYFKALSYFTWAEKSKHAKDHDFRIRYNRATCYYHIAKMAEKLGVLKESITNVESALEAYQTLFLTYPHHQKLLTALEATHLYHQRLLDKISEATKDESQKNSEDGDSDSDEEGDEESDTDKDSESAKKMEAGKPSDKSKKMEESTKSPEDILQEEMENNAQRDKGDDDSKPMKKDW